MPKPKLYFGRKVDCSRWRRNKQSEMDRLLHSSCFPVITTPRNVHHPLLTITLLMKQ